MKKPKAAIAAHPVPTMFGTPIHHARPSEPSRSTVCTIREASEALGVGITTARKLIDSGELPSLMLRGRRLVKVESISKLIAARERGHRK